MKSKKWLLIILAVVVIAAAAAIIIINFDRSGGSGAVPPDGGPVPSEAVSIDASAGGLTLVSVDPIAGIYVEDGSDEPLSDIFTATFRNDGGKTLQYARLTLGIGDEQYTFEISTLPVGESVRAMERERSEFPEISGDLTLSAESIAWFDPEPSLCESSISITPRAGALVIENVSGEALAAPIYVYYKNYVDGVYVGGITYRGGTQAELAPGEAIAVNAGHFDPDASRLMFVTLAP